MEIKNKEIYYNIFEMIFQDERSLKEFIRDYIKEDYGVNQLGGYIFNIDLINNDIDEDKLKQRKYIQNAEEYFNAVEILNNPDEYADSIINGAKEYINNAITNIKHRLDTHGIKYGSEEYFLRSIMDVSPNITGYDFKHAHLKEYDAEAYAEYLQDIAKDNYDVVSSVRIPDNDIAEYSLSDIMSYTVSNNQYTLYLGVPSYHGPMADIASVLASIYQADVNLYFGNGNVRGLLYCKEGGSVELDNKEPSKESVTYMLDILGLEYLSSEYFGWVLEENDDLDVEEMLYGHE